MIPFNKPYMTGKEMHYIYDAVYSGKISGNGKYTVKCQNFFQSKYSFGRCLLTSSCTDALEMAAILLDIKAGDEVIMPAFTFVSTANAFVLRGAKIVFCDSRKDHPGMDEELIASLITPKTKAIVVVHYAGVACDMDKIMTISEKYNLFVVEDAAQGIDSYYVDKKGDKKPLGSFGHFAAFSFHETKNIISGEGGMLVINDSSYVERAEIIWEKGTNRSKFFRGEIDKYDWVDIGSSFLPSELTAAFLFAQLENIELIQKKRLGIWKRYNEELLLLEKSGKIALPKIPNYATNNAHIFYIICSSIKERTALINKLKQDGILAVFHYISLHSSPFYRKDNDSNIIYNSDKYTNCLLRLPIFYDLKRKEQSVVINSILDFYNV
jgi:dTDP-4-amino-4,6-dideoxygalactose transaminase